jgi:hypothetical protein
VRRGNVQGWRWTMLSEGQLALGEAANLARQRAPT